MGTRMRDLLGDALPSLRYEPTDKHLRIYLGGEPVADTVNGLLVWEPRRVVPTYAVPEADISARLESVGRVDDLADLPILVPTNPFTAHSCTGEMFDVVLGTESRPSAAFRPDDPDLAGYVTFDFSAFEWREEDEPIVAHPHDPFKRIDILASSRHVRVEVDGVTVADSGQPKILFETGLPPRYYLPLSDVRLDLLQPSATRSHCPYKGTASYWSVDTGRAVHADIVWIYRTPLPESQKVAGLACFYNEKTDLYLDGVLQQRPQTKFS
jgi:uncharacterized protein (DUF427 family)